MTYEDLAQRVVAGDQRAIARAISVVEDETAETAPLLGPLFGRAGRARVFGLTGAPGVGKSTLVDRLTAEWRRAGERVGVVAVDPTSPFTGGAVLGDRVRMQAHAGDSGVYVRSMATRGHLGGLAQATGDAVLVLDAAGHDVVVIETVGVGQGEVDIARTADVSIVVTVPGTGDDVQALKAGIMEIADIFVVNKADRDGADRAVAEIEAMLALQESPGADRPAVCKTQASTGAGVAPLVRRIDALAHGARDRGSRRADRTRLRLRAALTDRFLDAVGAAPIDAAVERIVGGKSDPYREADAILHRALASARVAAPGAAGGGSRAAAERTGVTR
ncbi:MAG: methylmalonyl Co-A mutase-associated GTPase MeaB [Acidobacteria bacterium]|nr:methylmalonyl Co-A mutase-associated GTPase MeaB [Acidobacteriota bacterium]